MIDDVCVFDSTIYCRLILRVLAIISKCIDGEADDEMDKTLASMCTILLLTKGQTRFEG